MISLVDSFANISTKIPLEKIPDLVQRIVDLWFWVKRVPSRGLPWSLANVLVATITLSSKAHSNEFDQTLERDTELALVRSMKHFGSS